MSLQEFTDYLASCGEDINTLTKEEKRAWRETFDKKGSAGVNTEEIPQFVMPNRKALNFPDSGIGIGIIKRSVLVNDIINKLNDLMLEQNGANIYLRGPRATGKTFLLYLIGEKLQQEKKLVYFVRIADLLAKYDEKYFQRLEEKHKGEVIYLLVDEVHDHIYHRGDAWNYLLKESKRIITIGVGIFESCVLPPFKHKEEGSYLLLNSIDVEESLPFYQKLSNIQDISKVKAVLDEVLEFTGGQAYPYFHISEYLLTKHQDKCLNNTYSSFLRSPDFCQSNIYKILTNRALSLSIDAYESAFKIFRSGTTEGSAVLKKSGVWLDSKNWFISEMLVNYLFSKIEKDINCNVNLDGANAIYNVIKFGFSDLKEDDFYEPDSRTLRYEDSLVIIIGYKLAKIPNLYLSPVFQIRRPHGRSGSHPRVDLFINGRFNLYLEFLKNGSNALEHIQRFDAGGKYQTANILRNFMLIDIHCEEKEHFQPPDKYKKNYLTFSKKYNTLTGGTLSVPLTNVSKNLKSSPEIKKFSTLVRAFRHLK